MRSLTPRAVPTMRGFTPQYTHAPRGPHAPVPPHAPAHGLLRRPRSRRRGRAVRLHELAVLRIGRGLRGSGLHAALGRTYAVTVRTAEANRLTIDGSAWGADSPPDLFVDFGPVDEAGRAGADACTTNVVPDRYTASWNNGCLFTVSSGGAFGFEAWDEDVGRDANVLAFEAQDDARTSSPPRS